MTVGDGGRCGSCGGVGRQGGEDRVETGRARKQGGMLALVERSAYGAVFAMVGFVEVGHDIAMEDGQEVMEARHVGRR